MSRRPRDPDSDALWSRVAATVRPLRKDGSAPRTVITQSSPRSAPTLPKAVPGTRLPPAGANIRSPTANTLDASWDRRLRQGLVAPDLIVDLHGHTLASAHFRLEQVLGDAVARGARLILLIVGKPRGINADQGRGAIRASVADWIAASSHASSIAAIRGAHRRHGGVGSLYIVLRRSRR